MLNKVAWRTPGARSAFFWVRPGTNDEMVTCSVVSEDEYHVGGLQLEGTALDIGAHIGAMSVLLGLDYPELRIIAVEPVPENVQLLRANLALNGLLERVTVLEAAVGPGKRVQIGYHWRGDQSADMHTWIGNQFFSPGTQHDVLKVPAVSLSKLVGMAGGKVCFAKVDCEGCEEHLFHSPARRHVARMHGERHRGPAVEPFTVLQP